MNELKEKLKNTTKRVKYADYKNKYESFDTVKDSYDKETKTIELKIESFCFVLAEEMNRRKIYELLDVIEERSECDKYYWGCVEFGNKKYGISAGNNVAGEICNILEDLQIEVENVLGRSGERNIEL